MKLFGAGKPDHPMAERKEATRLLGNVGGRQHVYMPQGVAERGDDYEIVRFKEMVKEA
jgi:hypothetical protein